MRKGRKLAYAHFAKLIYVCSSVQGFYFRSMPSLSFTVAYYTFFIASIFIKFENENIYLKKHLINIRFHDIRTLLMMVKKRERKYF